MDFVRGLPQTPRGIDNIWVIVDLLTKSSHFLQVRSTFCDNAFARVYIQEIVRLHSVTVSIILDRESQFTSSFFIEYKRDLGTKVDLNTNVNPQIGGQSEHNFQDL